MGSLFGNIARGIGGAVMSASRSPLMKVIPGVGTALSVVGAASAVGGMLGIGGSSGGQLPQMPGMPGLPSAPGMGDRSILRNDPNLPDMLKPYAISKANLRQYYRAPKGFVIRHDEKGDAYGIPKKLARAYLGWKPAKKPLISIRDTNAIRHAGTAIKKLQKAEKMAKKIANWHSPHARPKYIETTGHVVGKRKVA